VQRAESCINTVTELPIPGNKGKGRPKKTWAEYINNDISECGLSDDNPMDKVAWRNGVRRSLVLPTPWLWDPGWHLNLKMDMMKKRRWEEISKWSKL